MALSVTSNFAISAGYAANNMKGSQTLMGKSINRISSGLKAPKPADDITSYISGTKLKTDSAGYNALSSGVQDAAARLNMMDSVLAEVSNSLLDLKAQAIAYEGAADGSGSMTTEQTNLNIASQRTVAAINAMATAKYKGANLFEDTNPLDVYYGWLETGTANNQKLSIAAATNLQSPATTLSTASITDISNSGSAGIQTAINNITAQRASLGGNLSALEQISNYLSAAATTSNAAYSAVTEVDMAKEMTAYVKNNIQSQASQAMVAQANQSLAQVLNLLQV